MSLLFPLGMAAAGALVPLILLYLLKQKRVEVKVPTNFLWLRAMEDLRASSLFQRLRATLLLLLQALAVVLFALAAAGASLDLRLSSTPRHVVVLLDRSASMKAADEGRRTRFEVAKELAKEQAASLSGADEMMIVGFDARSEVVAAFTSDRQRLAQVIDELAPRDLGTKAGDALRLAVSFAQASKGFDTEIYVLSDGGIEDDLPSVPFPVTYARIGRSGANQGIASVQVGRTPGEAAQVFVRVENGANEPVERTLSLCKGKEALDARAVSLPAGGGATAFFELPEPEDKDPVVLTVALEGKDALAADDAAVFVLRPSVPRSGLLVAAEPSLYLDAAKVERLHPGLALVAATPADAAAAIAAGGIDFVCYDGVEPATPPDVPAQLWIGAVPPGSGLVRKGTQQFPIIVDWDRTHPATARCQFDDVMVEESIQLSGTERSRTLIDSTGGPLALLTPVARHEVVVLAFSPSKSNLPLKLSWPLFLANVLDVLLGGIERAGEEPLSQTGTAIVVEGGRSVTVTTPSGAKVEVPPDARGRASFAATNESGLYRVKQEDGPEELHACALLDASEVRIAPRAELVVGSERLPGVSGGIQRNLLLRDPLLLAALGLLVVEWALWCSRR